MQLLNIVYILYLYNEQCKCITVAIKSYFVFSYVCYTFHTLQKQTISWLFSVHASNATVNLHQLYAIIIEAQTFKVLSTQISCEQYSIIYTKVHVIVSGHQKGL